MIALARAALQFREVKVASDALARVDVSGKETGPYLFAMSQLAEAEGDKPKAEDFATRASERMPNEASYQLQVGLLRLQLPTKRDSGRALLTALRADPKMRTSATRALIAYAVEHHETGTSIRDLAEELQSYPEAGFSDRLLYLDILRQLNDARFTSYLTEVENAASTNSVDLGSLISWMNRSSLSTLAIDYVRQLPAESIAKWPVPLALAESYSNVGSWEQLKDLARDGAWGGFEFLRHAFLARAYRGEDNAAQFSREWEAAMKDAAKDPQHLTVLARTVGEWRWRAEAEDILWQMAKLPEMQNEALRTLYREYARRGDTTNLYRVLTRLNAADPQDLLVRNNLAQIGLLLNADVPSAVKAAGELYRDDASNAAYATTYAFGLYKTGKIPEAVQVLASLKEDQLNEPSVSLYCGVILAAAGDKERAAAFLKRAEPGTSLLPEEKALLADGRRRVGL
ncbi:MAG: tetratricopeptide repeat protein [Chthoniobacterales bacterium]